MSEKARIAVLSFQFALRIIELFKILVAQHEHIISKQLLRSGTSIGANVAEASAAQSSKDFISKMAIASKEARETRYWLNLLSQSRFVSIDLSPWLKEITSINNILSKIVKTSQSKLTPKT